MPEATRANLQSTQSLTTTVTETLYPLQGLLASWVRTGPTPLEQLRALTLPGSDLGLQGSGSGGNKREAVGD